MKIETCNESNSLIFSFKITSNGLTCCKNELINITKTLPLSSVLAELTVTHMNTNLMSLLVKHTYIHAYIHEVHTIIFQTFFCMGTFR